MATLTNILKKAQEHADAASFPSARLFGDMQPLSFQVNTACNTARKAVRHLTCVEFEGWEDRDKTLDWLIARCENTAVQLRCIDSKQVEGKEAVMVELSFGSAGTKHLTGKDYVLTYVLPNFFFHLQSAYAILRMNGCSSRKGRLLGAVYVPGSLNSTIG
ncbi:uncharacterized protein BKA55DRAFT_543726 [Fusarium redolens]|uniref:DUF1993 domain-containing protein n=1 Tax=Fusarium redolens TaxID=48865 RepID=A0A9P9GDL2_FUSRE|nr:uncharacterized protein BKA55DRAFT_543726 [Fusarium redolens]KAH7237091.1 hypothetical protein BKA55DRAFT_543726 [Fusarium redolens]